jgi:hypothetical protein
VFDQILPGQSEQDLLWMKESEACARHFSIWREGQPAVEPGLGRQRPLFCSER